MLPSMLVFILPAHLSHFINLPDKHAISMVRIYIGYIIEQDELVCFLHAQVWSPEPGEPEVTVDNAWLNFMSWLCSQLQNGDPKMLLLWPQCVSFSLKLLHVLTSKFSYRHVC